MRGRRDPRSLSEKRLAMTVAENRGRASREAAQVLTDVRELKYGAGDTEAIWTGRVRSAPYEFMRLTWGANQPSLLRRRESMGTYGRVFVPVYEYLHNVQRYGRSPSDKFWDDIWVSWTPRRRDTYRALVRIGALQRTIRFGELEWQWRVAPGGQESVGLYLVRTPPRRKRPQRMYLFDVRRQENPATAERYFVDEQQQRLFS